MNIRNLFLIIGMLWCCNINAQETPKQEVKKIQPKVMVIPYTKGDVSIAQEFDKNNLVRIAISNIKEAFDRRNFPTVDAQAKLKLMQNDKVMEIENQTSIKQELIELSGADIYVEVEASINRGSSGNSLTLILSAFDAFTGVSLANASGVSSRFYTESFEKLVPKVVEENIDDFMQLIQNRFDDMNTNGRMIAVNISIAEDSEFDMDYEFEELETLSDKIESWFENNSYQSYYHIQGVTATKMIIDEARIPLRTKSGKNYKVSSFVKSLRKYLLTMDITTTRDVQGGRIFITIQ